MPRRSNNKEPLAWFRVGTEESEEGQWIRAAEAHEAVREWCKGRDREGFWQYVSTAVVETLYGGMDDHYPDRPWGLAKKWHVDASQPPAWIIERIPEAD